MSSNDAAASPDAFPLPARQMNDIVSTVLAALAMAMAMGSLISRQPAHERRLLGLSLYAHLAAGAAMTPVTEHILGGGDLLLYQRIGGDLLGQLFRAPGDTGSVLLGLLLHDGNPLPVPDYGYAVGSSGAMIALTTASLLITGGSLYAVCVLVSGFSFLAKLWLYDVFRAELDARLHRQVLIATMLVPSVIFWSSGVIKEAFAFIGLGLVFKHFYRFYKGRLSTLGIAAGAAGLFLIATTKGYLLIPLGMAAGASMVLSRVRAGVARPASFARKMVVIVTSVVVISGAGVLSSRYDPGNVIDTTGQMQDVGEQVTGGSGYTLVKERSLSGQIAALPLVLVTTLFRPAIFEARNAQMAANGLEVTFFTVLALRALRRGVRGYRVIRAQPVLVFCGVFSSVMAIGVGLASTNLGTLSRYRMPMMPFLWVLVTVVASLSPVAVRELVAGRPQRVPTPREPLRAPAAQRLSQGAP